MPETEVPMKRQEEQIKDNVNALITGREPYTILGLLHTSFFQVGNIFLASISNVFTVGNHIVTRFMQEVLK